ncbi:MAG: tetratricopeptide repeat protein [Candidatus Sulfotelmatobacter sp.]
MLRWSFTTTEQANWHPVTWLSHALDCQLFQLDAGYHHLTSLLIHCVNSVLLFLLLFRVTAALGRSFLVSALFAWHPFNVQSVAWIAERKNVLSTMFIFLALAAYGWYVRKPRPSRLGTVCVLFALSLASKPMAVTLPFVLLLLDYWPLARIQGLSPGNPAFPLPQRTLKTLLVEKVPLLFLSATSCAITIWAQKAGGAVQSLDVYPLGTRLSNGLYSYVVYIWKTFIPIQFAIDYPHPGHLLPLWKPILAAAVLGAVTAAVWRNRARYPYILVGWLWFLGTLIPVIGIVQVGSQAMADRYAYLPLIGVFLIVAWGGKELAAFLKLPPAVPLWVAILTLATLLFLTTRELDYWQDSVSLWSRALQVSPNSSTSEQHLAAALMEQGDDEEALPHYLNAVRLNPRDLATRSDLGAYYGSHSRTQDAIREFQTVIALSEGAKLAHVRAGAELNIGLAYVGSHDFSNALASFREAYRVDPAMPNRILATLQKTPDTDLPQGAYLQVALLLAASGQRDQGLTMLEKGLQVHPEYQRAKELLAFLASGH